MLEFLRKVMSGATEESSKRFIGVVCMILFGVFFLEMIVLMPFVLFKAIPASQTTLNLFFAIFDKLLYYTFVIICVAIGAVGVVGIMSKVSDVLANKGIASIIAAQKGIPPDANVVNQNVEQQNVGNSQNANAGQSNVPKQNVDAKKDKDPEE